MMGFMPDEAYIKAAKKFAAWLLLAAAAITIALLVACS